MGRFAAIALALSALFTSTFPTHADEVRTERVQFAQGASSTTIKGQVTGYNSVQYLVGAKAGQTMTVTLKSDSGGNEFHVYAPSVKPGEGTAMDVGSGDPQSFEGTLPADGDYTIQVYLVRAMARREETANYTVTISITGGEARSPAKAGAVAAASADAKVEGTEFSATGTIPCSRYEGQPMNQCKFGVVREGNGNGHIAVTWFDGGKRVIFFEDNTPVRYDESEADGGANMAVDKQADLYSVRIGDMRFEFPEAVMTGG